MSEPKEIQILHKFTQAVLFKAAVTTITDCLAIAIGSGANLSGADLRYADLSGADLRYADLRYADLSGADLSGANLPSPTMVLLASWGDVNPELCRDLMIYNAACHPDPSAFTRWANRQSGCPYASAKVQRAADFQERREYWSDTAPLRRPYDLMVRVLAEKCPAWTGAQQAEFNGKYKGNVSTQSAAE
jgi:hypothetical protein